MGLAFEWDEEKARANLKNHKVGFAEAKTIFSDPFLWTFADLGHSNTEERCVSIETAAVMTAQDDMLPEYDFASMKGGVRGKYSKVYREGHTVEIRKADGTTSTQYFRLEDGAVMLEPDVREYFPDSEAVNRALRALIAIAPRKTTAGAKRTAGQRT